MIKYGTRLARNALIFKDPTVYCEHSEFTFRFNRRFFPFNAFRSLFGIAGDVTAPTYAEFYAKKSRPTTSSGCL